MIVKYRNRRMCRIAMNVQDSIFASSRLGDRVDGIIIEVLSTRNDREKTVLTVGTKGIVE